MVSAAELDTAIAARRVELTRRNARPVRCTLETCRRLCKVGEAARLWIDGHKRGFLCLRCAKELRQ
jgi:hypothetical protein